MLLKTFGRELAKYPERVGVYKDIASAQVQLDKKREAKETLKEWAAADTKNPDASVELAEMQLGDGDAAAAVTAAEQAVSRFLQTRRTMTPSDWCLDKPKSRQE